MSQPNIPPQRPAPQQYATGAQQYAPQAQQQYSQQYAQQPAQAAPAQPSPLGAYIKQSPVFLGLIIATGVYALFGLIDFIMNIADSSTPTALSGLETAAWYAMINLAITFAGLLLFYYAPAVKAAFFKMSLIAQCVGYGLWLVRWLMQLANSGSYSTSDGYYTVIALLWFGMVVAVVLNVLFLVLQLGKLRGQPAIPATIK